MFIVKIFGNESQGIKRALYVFHDEQSNHARYVFLTSGPYAKHLNLYMNVDKSEWLTVADDFRDVHCITFEGIESTKLAIPVDFSYNVPVLIQGYWIGIDYMSIPGISTEQALINMESIVEAYNALTIKQSNHAA